MNVELENKDISSLSQAQHALKHTHTHTQKSIIASDRVREERN